VCRRSRSGGRARNCSACASRNKVRAPIKVSNFVQMRESNKRIRQKNTSTIRVTDVQNVRIARAGRTPRQTYMQTKNDSDTSDRRTYDTNDIARREGTRSQTYVRRTWRPRVIGQVGEKFPYAPSMRNRPLVARIRVSEEQISTHQPVLSVGHWN
jgi:hypothetical protein